MPVKIIHPDHTEVVGEGLVLLSSPHITTSKRDLYTGQIVEEAALLSKSWAIIAKERKQLQSGDETQSADANLEKSVQDFVGEYGIKCVIAISGVAEPGITVKSQGDGSESEEILDIIRSGLEPHFSSSLRGTNLETKYWASKATIESLTTCLLSQSKSFRSKWAPRN